MHHLPKKLALVSAIAILASCSKSDTVGSGNDPLGGDGGGTAPTGQVALSATNFESEAKFIGPRVHAILGEVFRNLELINAVVDINAKMGLASSVPRDDLLSVALDGSTSPLIIGSGGANPPLAIESCSNSGGINTAFFDFDLNGGLSTNDVILRDFDNVSCTYEFVDGAGDTVFDDDTSPRERRVPATLTGSISYRFDSGPPSTPNYVGTATLGDPDTPSGLSYEIADGLLRVADASESDSFKGTVGFDINFAAGTAIFRDISVLVSGSSSGLNGPNLITIGTVTRTLSGAGDSVSIDNGLIVSQTDGQSIAFRTIPYNGNGANELSAPSGGLPNRGAILYEGGNGTAARARTDINGGIPVVDLELTFNPNDGLDNVASPGTVNQFDDGEQAEPGGSAWFVSGFLLAPDD